MIEKQMGLAEGPVFEIFARPFVGSAFAMFHITLDRRRGLSVEVYRQLRRGILAGQLRPGDRLPPSRELAREISVARATVTTAYERLAAEGFVTSQMGSGTFVAKAAVSDVSSSISGASDSPLQPRAVWDTITIPTDFDAPARFDFRGGLPDASLFPHRRWRRLVSRALRTSEVAAGPYEHPAGVRLLREAIARHIGVSRGVNATPDDIIVTNGTQQALDILARVLLAPGDSVVVEDPGYGLPRRLFHSLGVRVVGVRADHGGLDTDALPKQARLAYVTPSHQYPLGVTMTLHRRQALLAWAERSDAAIVEDDYDSEFRFGERPLEALHTLDSRGRVIFVGSFSKTMLPTLRLGFLVAPPSLRAALHRAKLVADWHTSTLEQTALAYFIDEGGFARHIRKARRVYRQRHSIIAETIIRDFAGLLEIIPSASGLHLSALAPELSVEAVAALTRRAAADGVAVTPLSLYSAGTTPCAGILFGYGAIAADEIPEALQRLRDCFR